MDFSEHDSLSKDSFVAWRFQGGKIFPEALARGVELFNERAFFECHEVLEDAWREENGPLRDLYQGLIKVAVAFYHGGKGNYVGAIKVLNSGIPQLCPYENWIGLEIDALIPQLQWWLKVFGQLQDQGGELNSAKLPKLVRRAESYEELPAMTPEQIHRFLDHNFPQAKGLIVESTGLMAIRVRMPFHKKHLRPGGTISGPALMMLADASMFLAILAQLGPLSHAVTTNLNINFLRKAQQKDVIAECQLLKLSKSSAVGEIHLFSEGKSDPVAHATATYAIPSHS